MASTKRLTEDEIENRLVNRPVRLIKGTFKNIKSNAEWECLTNTLHGIFFAPPRQIIHAKGNCPKCSKVSRLTESLIIERLIGRPIELIGGTLKGSDIFAQWRCLTDATHPIWESTPSSVLNAKSGCPICAGKLPLTENEIKKRLSGKNISLVIDSYIHETRKARWRCLANQSHADWTASVKAILYQNTGCPNCAGNTPLTEEVAKHRLGNRPIALIEGSLKGARGKAKWRCLINNEHPIWSASAGSVLGGSNCPACTGHVKLDVDVVYRKINDRPIKLISEHIEGSGKKAVWACLTDSNHANWKATVGSVLAGSGCPECAGNAKLNSDKINKRLLDRNIKIKNDTFKASSDYAVWHCLAGKEHPDWQANVSSVLSGVGCPDCAEYGFKENKSAYIYIMTIGDMNDPIGVKCGITNNHPTERRGQINRKTNEAITLVKYWHHKSGNEIRKLEKLIMEKYKHKDLQGLLKDGGTETYYYEDFDSMSKFIDSSLM